MNNPFNINYWPGLKRAVEIAKMCDYSISVFFGSNYSDAPKDYLAIKEFYKGFFDNFVDNGDLFVYMNTPWVSNFVSDCSIDTIKAEVDKAMLLPDRLYFDATATFNFPGSFYPRYIPCSREHIKLTKIANAISKLNNNYAITIEDFDKAKEYMAVYEKVTLCNAESGENLIFISSNITH